MPLAWLGTSLRESLCNCRLACGLYLLRAAPSKQLFRRTLNFFGDLWKDLKWLLWIGSALLVLAGLWGLGRTALTRSSPADFEAQLMEAFWRLEAGEALSPSERARLAALPVPDTAPRAYALAVLYRLLYAPESLEGPPMLYIQRLQQLKEDPWVLAYLARLAGHTGQTEKALLYLHQALEKDSTCWPAYLFLAQLQTDSACYWLQRAATALLPPSASPYPEKLKAQLRCL